MINTIAWVRSCVGYKNMRFFILFLFYYSLGNFATALKMVYYFNAVEMFSFWFKFGTIFTIIYLGLTAFSFSALYMYLTLKGATIIELSNRDSEGLDDSIVREILILGWR